MYRFRLCRRFDHDRIVPGRIDHDLALKGNRIHVDDVVAGHFGGGAVDDDAFENAFPAEDQIDHSRQVHDLRAGIVSGGNQRTCGMRRIDHVHAVAFFDLLARDADLFEDFIGRVADGGLIHEIAAMPEAAAEREALLDDERCGNPSRPSPGANQAGRSGADDDHVALDELIELFIVFARDLPGDVSLS